MALETDIETTIEPAAAGVTGGDQGKVGEVSPAPAGDLTLAQGADGTKLPPPKDWPDDWRDRFAGEDKKYRKRLDAIGSPLEVAKSFRELEAKFSASRQKSALPDKPTEEQLAAYRAESGIPADGKYNTELGDGFVWADDDTATLEDFSKAAFATNMPQAEVTKALAWYADYQQRSNEAAALKSKELRHQAEDELRSEYGDDYRGNVNAIESLLTRMDPDLRRMFVSTKMDSGHLLGDHPGLLRFFSELARELNPAASILPGSSDPAKDIKGRQQEIEGMMGDHSSEYWRGPKSEALQEEWRRLHDAGQRISARAG